MVKTLWRTDALLAGASAAIAGLLLAGCANSPSDAKPLPEETVTATASRTPVAEEAEALATYRAMWDDLAAVAVAPDPEHPRLEAHASGGALELLRYMMRKSREEEVVAKGRLHLDPVVESRKAAKVVIRDCADGTDWLNYTKDGRLQDDVPGGHHRVDATVLKSDGAWRVDHLYIDQVGTC